MRISFSQPSLKLVITILKPTFQIIIYSVDMIFYSICDFRSAIGAAIILVTTQIGLFRSGFTRSLPIAAAICLKQVIAGAFVYTKADLKSQME
jgi:hypothetical protein